MKTTITFKVYLNGISRLLLAVFLCWICSFQLYASALESPGVFLMNAATGEEIDDIEFAVYNLADLPKSLTIVDVFTGFLPPDEIESVTFILNNKVIRTENIPPYALGGDTNGNFHPFNFTPGEYMLETQYYSEDQAKGTLLGSTIVYFTIIDVPPILFDISPIRVEVAAGQRIQTDFTINVGETNIAYDLLLDDRYVPTWLSFPAEVKEGLNTVEVNAENLAPGTYQLLNPILVILQAKDIPYSQSAQIDVELTVTESNTLLVYGFTILDAESDLERFSYTVPAASQDFFSMPMFFNVRADINPEVVGSVVFEYAYQCYDCPAPVLKRFRTENVTPYALFGDTNGNYYEEALAGGTYYIKATPYSKKNGKGAKGFSKEFQLYIYNAPSNARIAYNQKNNITKIFPNPFQLTATIEHQVQESEWVTIDIYDLQGALVERLFHNQLNSLEHISLTFQPESTTPKLYLCRIQSGEFVETERLYFK